MLDSILQKWILLSRDRSLSEEIARLSEAKFARISYTDAVQELKKAKVKFEFPVDWGLDLQSEHERYLTDVVFKGPAIVMNYPKDIKSFYMRNNDDGKTVAAMDVLAPRIGEIIGGSQREERIDLLEAKMKEKNIPADDLGWYLVLRRYGSAPHAGFGLGFERLVQYLTGMGNIRDVIPCPRAPGTIAF
jgi:asparaginyl-tRNA synthetase